MLVCVVGGGVLVCGGRCEQSTIPPPHPPQGGLRRGKYRTCEMTRSLVHLGQEETG